MRKEEARVLLAFTKSLNFVCEPLFEIKNWVAFESIKDWAAFESIENWAAFENATIFGMKEKAVKITSQMQWFGQS